MCKKTFFSFEPVTTDRCQILYNWAAAVAAAVVAVLVAMVVAEEQEAIYVITNTALHECLEKCR